MKLEEMFRRVHPNSADLFTDGLLCRICNHLILAQTMPFGAVHTNSGRSPSTAFIAGVR